MYKQSNEAKLAYQSAERTLDIVVNVNGVDYKATDIEQFDYDSGGYTGDTFSIGSTYENNITVKFIHLVEGLKRGMIVKPRIGIKLPNGTFEYTPLGVFIIADEIQMDRNNNSTTIKAYDKFVVMEGQYVSKLAYPANAVDIITEIAQMCKVDVNTNDLAHLPTIKVSKAITKQSYRTAIGWIAQLYVGFASFDRDGKLTIRRVAEPNYTIEPSEYEQQGLVKNEAPYIIGGISCNINVVETTNNGETNETTHKLHSGSVNGSQIELTNDIMTQSLLDSIWDSLKSITFYPFSLNWFGNPAIEAGDWLSLKDMKGNVFVVPNNGYTISFNGGLSSTSKADQNATDSSTVKYTGELTRVIENYSRRQAPDGTNIYTDVKEPTDAKFNDVWFKPNGNSTELWIFERQADGSGKWVKQPVNGEVEQKINDALKEFDELDKSFKDNTNTQSSTNELMKSQIDSISNQIPNLSDEISRVNGNVTSLKTQTNKDRQQLQTTSQNLDQTRQDLLSNSNRIDKLTVDLDSVNINVNNVNSKVDNIKVGGTNLLKDSLVPLTTSNIWINNNVSSQIVNDYVRMRGIDDNDNNRIYQSFSNNGLNADDYYSISFWASNDGNDEEFDVQVGTWGSLQKVHITGSTLKLYKLENVWLGGNPIFSVVVPFDKVVRLKKIKLEKGTIATDWSPAPEDMTDKIEVVSGKVTANSNEFSTVYAKITNAKNDAINAIKGDSQWQSMGKIVTNASFLQNSDGFAQEVSKRITNDTGQTNLYYNSEFTYTGTDPHNMDGIQSTKNVAYSRNDRWSNYKGSNAVFASTRGTLSDYYYIEHKKDKYVKVQPGEVVSASVVTWVTGGSDVPRDGYAICTISFYKDLSSSRMRYKETSVAAKDIDYPNYKTLKVENVTVPDGANYMTLHLIIRGSSNWQFSQPMLVRDSHVGVYVPSTQLQLNQVIDTADSHTRTITDYLTGSNSRFVQMANYLNMNVGNSSVSINGDGVMLSGNRIKITGKTLIDNAVILDALIKDINANTVKTKELDASKINVTNLNANNITTGTISGANLNINLDSGNVSFQKGRIHSSNNYIDINIDQQYISTADNLGRLLFKGSSLQIAGSNIFDNSDDYYLKISNGLAGGSYRGANIVGRDYIAIANKANYLGDYLTMRIDFSGLAAGKSNTGWQPTLVGGADRGVLIAGGNVFSSNYAIGSSPFIAVGTNNDGPSTLGAREWYGKNIVINGEYTYIPSSYNKTTSSAPNVFVDSKGTLMRSTSASKYKSDISRTYDMDYGNKLLELPIATWIDKAEFERYAKKESEQPPIRHFGMIAEDLADVGLEMLVTRNKSGELEGIQYDRIAPALIPVIADLKRRLEILERKQQTNE